VGLAKLKVDLPQRVVSIGRWLAIADNQRHHHTHKKQIHKPRRHTTALRRAFPRTVISQLL